MPPCRLRKDAHVRAPTRTPGSYALLWQASGALSAHEIAVLRPSDLSLESIISLADLPIPGFPRTSAEASATAGNGNAKKANCEEVTGDSGGNIPTASSLGVAEGKTGEEEEPEVLIEFADASVGAVVTGCSSNYDTSGGVLQVRGIDVVLMFFPCGR